MPQFRRGAAAIEQAATRSRGKGSSSPFCPEIYWREADEKKYVLILTPIDEVTRVDVHDFIPISYQRANGESYTRNESFLSRKDAAIGEDFDKIEDELGRPSKTRIMGVAVELDPVMKTVKGRKRPTGFVAKTTEYQRKTDDGEENIVQPVIGIISQSSQLMWSPLSSMDASQGPLEELPLEVIRRIPGGQPSNTSYEFIPFRDIEVDLTPISTYVDGISYLRDVIDDLNADLQASDGDLQEAQTIARFLLDKRLEELADSDRYEELVGPLEELEPPPWEKKNKKAPSAPKASRSTRKSPRSKKNEVGDAEDEVEEVIEPEPTPEPESRENKFARLKASLGDK